MATPRRRASTSDLFEIFPDLPWARFTTREDKKAQIQRQVQDVRERAAANILRQRAASERVRAALAQRWRRP
jgi:hypothetical protein